MLAQFAGNAEAYVKSLIEPRDFSRLFEWRYCGRWLTSGWREERTVKKICGIGTNLFSEGNSTRMKKPLSLAGLALLLAIALAYAADVPVGDEHAMSRDYVSPKDPAVQKKLEWWEDGGNGAWVFQLGKSGS
jgi:hypothetical protein